MASLKTELNDKVSALKLKRPEIDREDCTTACIRKNKQLLRPFEKVLSSLHKESAYPLQLASARDTQRDQLSRIAAHSPLHNDLQVDGIQIKMPPLKQWRNADTFKNILEAGLIKRIKTATAYSKPGHAKLWITLWDEHSAFDVDAIQGWLKGALKNLRDHA